MEGVNDLGPLINYGAIGVVLAWFMWRHEQTMKLFREEMQEVREAGDRTTRALLLHTLAFPGLSGTTKSAAQEALVELEEAQKRDADKRKSRP